MGVKSRLAAVERVLGKWSRYCHCGGRERVVNVCYDDDPEQVERVCRGCGKLVRLMRLNVKRALYDLL